MNVSIPFHHTSLACWFLVCLFVQSVSFALTIETSNESSSSVSSNIFGNRDEISITTNRGNTFAFQTSNLEPLVGLFDPLQYKVSASTAEHLESHKSTPISVFRTTIQNSSPETKQQHPVGTVLQVHVLDGVISLIEIHPPEGPVVFVVHQEENGESLYQEFTTSDFGGLVQIDNGEMPLLNPGQDGDDNRLVKFANGGHLRGRQMQKDTTFTTRITTRRDLLDFQIGDKSSNEYHDLTLVHLAIAYDEEFCQLYGSKPNARLRIQDIVAGASLFFEHDMCVQLVLVQIVEPATCDPNKSSFLLDPNVNRDNACQAPPQGTLEKSFLLGFTHKMRRHRLAPSLSLQSHVAVHLFSGYNHKGRAALGCTYSKAYCDDQWSYGISYMSFSAANVAPQIIVAAHEMAHTLGVKHYDPEEDGDYIMRPSVTSGNKGFSEQSVKSLYEYLNQKKCHEVVPGKRTITATVVFPNDNVVYFFYTQANVALYSKYDLESDSVSDKYPRQVLGHWGRHWPNSNWWPTGGFVTNDRAYFLKNNIDVTGKTRGKASYLAYMFDNGDVDPDKYPQDMDTWNGLPADLHYRAAVLFPNNNLYLFDGDDYYKFDLDENEAGQGDYPRKVVDHWPNWPAKFETTAGFVTPNGEYAYFFGFEREGHEGEQEWDHEPLYIRYNLESGEVDRNPRSVQSHWPGVLD